MTIMTQIFVAVGWDEERPPGSYIQVSGSQLYHLECLGRVQRGGLTRTVVSQEWGGLGWKGWGVALRFKKPTPGLVSSLLSLPPILPSSSSSSSSLTFCGSGPGCVFSATAAVPCLLQPCSRPHGPWTCPLKLYASHQLNVVVSWASHGVSSQQENSDSDSFHFNRANSLTRTGDCEHQP